MPTPRIGHIVTIPTGSYCEITLDSNERILITHEEANAVRGARLTVELLRYFGFSTKVVFQVYLDTAEGGAMLARLGADTSPGALGSLLRRLVESVKDCRRAADVVTRCQRLGAAAPGRPAETGA